MRDLEAERSAEKFKLLELVVQRARITDLGYNCLCTVPASLVKLIAFDRS